MPSSSDNHTMRPHDLSEQSTTSMPRLAGHRSASRKQKDTDQHSASMLQHNPGQTLHTTRQTASDTPSGHEYTFMSMPNTTAQLPTTSPRITHQLSFTQRETNPLSGNLQPLPDTAPRITRQLSNQTASTTQKLGIPNTSPPTRTMTRIPITEKRPTAAQTRTYQRRKRPLVLISTLICCLIVLASATILVTPIEGGQQGSAIIQTIGGIISSNSLGAFDPVQRIPTPTPTLAVLTNEGYCGGIDIWGTCAKAATNSGTIGTGVMHSPITGAIITQAFGTPEYQIWCGCVKPHSGIDLAAAYGTPITASDDGQVVWTGWDWSGLGWAVKISHGSYIATIYGHLARYIVKVGDSVTRGQTIAYEGSTGASTGPHVHFMVLVNNKWVNPTLYMSLP